jgi:hypothetical protein
MKPRHAAALALVGWYLIFPPQKSDGWSDYNAPLRKWIVSGYPYDNAQSCQDHLRGLRAMASTMPHSLLRDHFRDDFSRAKCAMLPDDPFFKKITDTAGPATSRLIRPSPAK